MGWHSGDTWDLQLGEAGSNFGLNISYLDWVFQHDFPQSLQVIARIVPWLCHGHLLPSPLQIIIHLSSVHSTLHTLATEHGIK